jgi:hypothetical protein
MKSLGFVLFILMTGQLLAQGEVGSVVNYFEGTIKYNITIDGGVNASGLKENKPCKNMDMHFKGGDYIINLFNGDFPTTRLFIADSNRMFVVDPVNQRAFRGDGYQGESPTIPTAIPLPDTKVILGDTCKAFRVEKPGRKTTYYVSDKYRANVSLFKGKSRADAAFLIKGLGGRIPLMTIVESKTLKTTITAVKVEPRKFETNLFRIPKGWKILGADYRR